VSVARFIAGIGNGVVSSGGRLQHIGTSRRRLAVGSTNDVGRPGAPPA
jgi:hypothetical protein